MRYRRHKINFLTENKIEWGWYIPTAGDIDREPDDPVGDGVGLIASEFGVPGAVPTPVPTPLELSLLFCPIESWK